MLTSDVTWGSLRAFHEMLQKDGSSSPDDLLSQKEFAEKSIGKRDDEKVFEDESDPTIVYSVTTDEDKTTLLELVVADEVEGRIAYRSDGKWVEVGPEEYPESIYEVPMYDIDSSSVDWVISYWDDQESEDSSPTLDDIRQHLA